MQRYVAFLSGLPAGREAVEQARLESLFRRLGFLSVEAILTTGNVAFETGAVGVIAPLEAQISRHLKRSIEAPVWTFVRTLGEIKEIVSGAPSTDTGTSRFVILLSEELDERSERALRVRRSDVDVLVPAGRHVYWTRENQDHPTPPPPLSEILDVPATVRSLPTFELIISKYASVAGQPRKDAPTESELFRQ